MKDPKKQLINLETELVEAKKLADEKKRAVGRARSPKKRDNKAYALKVAEEAVRGLREHRHALEEIVVRKSSATRSFPKRKRRVKR